jgi:hypothetical protein
VPGAQRCRGRCALRRGGTGTKEEIGLKTVSEE